MAAKNKWHSEDDRIRAASVYAVTGNAQRTAEITGIPAGTIRQWKTQNWWPQVIDRVRTEHDDEVDAKISKIIDQTLTQIEDRVENGDYVINMKTGEVLKERAPMKGKDVAVVTSIMMDKRDLIRRKEKTNIEQQSTQQLIKGLLEEFRKFTGQKTVEGEVLNKDVTDIEEEKPDVA